MLKTIIKRDGSEEPFLPSKINNWSIWASEQLGNRVDWSSVVMEAMQAFKEKASSQELQKQLIKICVRRANWAYSLMAGRLYAAMSRKEIYDSIKPPTIEEVHKNMAMVGLMRKLDYTSEEYQQIEKFIDHQRDFEMAYPQLLQLRKKYAIRNRVTKQEYESAQFVYMRMAMALAEDEPKDQRLNHIVNWYNHFSFNRINAPSPNYINLGTSLNGYASCCVFKSDDKLESLAIGDHIAYRMTGMSAGIGGILDTRTLGDPVRGGAISHQGKLPYYRALGKATKANQQAGRGGAATSYYSAYDPENTTIAQLQNPLSTEDKRIRDIHFGVLYNAFFSKKVAKNEDVFLFTSYSAPDLWEAMFSGDAKEFERIYNEYDQSEYIEKKYINARDFVVLARQQAYETGTHYEAFIDEMNRHTPFKDPIYSSNLCVAPETTILVKDVGYVPIKDYKDKEVTLWNGFEWTTVTVRQTGQKRKLVKVVLSDGKHLTCTEQHKWHIQPNYYSESLIKETKDLKNGDWIKKYTYPIIKGNRNLDKPYINGFYSGDGTELNNMQLVYLYHEKKGLLNYFQDYDRIYFNDASNRIAVRYRDLKEKFFVPDADIKLEDRLDWLAGLLDSDGTVHRNGENQSLAICSINLLFLEKTRSMLETMGVVSKITLMRDEGYFDMPTNDGTEQTKKYFCKRAYRLLINSVYTQTLIDLGLKLRRLNIIKHKPNRSAEQFVKVIGVIDEGRIDDTYCFTDPLRHTGLFNGIMTGNCNEISLPTGGYQSMMDLYNSNDHGKITIRNVDAEDVTVAYADQVFVDIDGTFVKKWVGDLRKGMSYRLHENAPIRTVRSLKKDPGGEIAICALAGLVLTNIHSEQQYQSAAYYALKMIDKCIDMSDYPFEHVAMTAKARRSAGVGLLGLATDMARKKLSYSSQEGRDYCHKVAERHYYWLLEASLQLAKEKGNAAWMHRTKWPEGWLPIDTYKKQVDQIAKPVYHYDWEDLRARIKEQGGIRNSVIAALMPTESSAKASGVPNSIYPIRELSIKKSDNTNVIDWVATDSDLLKDDYEIAWDIPTMDMIKIYAIFQKFTDQGISADFWRDRSTDPIVYTDEIVEEHLAMCKYGMKGRYYQNSLTTDQDDIKNTEAMAKAAIDNIVQSVQQSSKAVDDEDELADSDRGCAGGACSL